MNLDEFADYTIEADIVNGGLLFKHRICSHSEQLEIDKAPLKFLMMKATEHHMEKHGLESINES